MRDAAGELHHLEAALHFAIGVRQDLAVLGGDDRGQFAAVALQQFLQLEHDAGAAQRRGGRPGRPRRGGGRDGLVHFACIGQRDAAGDLAGGRIEHVAEPAAGAGNRLAGDEMADLPHVAFLRVAPVGLGRICLLRQPGAIVAAMQAAANGPIGAGDASPAVGG